MTYIEEWNSTQGRSEVHYFRDDDEYLFGYNPLLLNQEQIDTLKNMLTEI
jgi:hypothetical protein